MLKKLSFLAGLAAVFAALAAVLSGGAAADPILNLDGCPTATPNATLTLGQLPNAVTGYATANLLCPRFVVDVNVAPTNGQHFEIDGSYAGPSTGPYTFDPSPLALSQSDCSLYTERVSLYRKPWFTLSPPAKFTLVSSAKFTGKWVPATYDPDFSLPAHCSKVLASGTATPYPLSTGLSPLGGATYRMAISIATTAPQKVRVHADYVPTIN
jgi:hypothetical protein